MDIDVAIDDIEVNLGDPSGTKPTEIVVKLETQNKKEEEKKSEPEEPEKKKEYTPVKMTKEEEEIQKLEDAVMLE